MCLIFISSHQHPNYKLIVAANRDEFYKRKTALAQYWKDHPEILGGRDLEAHGTWMAMTKSGKISMVTNYRDPHNIDPNAPSRGQLVSDFLIGKAKPKAYLKEVARVGLDYNGFNLIVGTLDQLYYYSNYKGTVEEIRPGLHGLSNHLLDTEWPKVRRGKVLLDGILSQDQIEPDRLFDFLYDDEVAEDSELPDTGIGLERERILSSMFIKSAGYGSRCSTVVLVGNNNHVTYAERVYNVDTFEHQTQTFEFKVES